MITVGCSETVAVRMQLTPATALASPRPAGVAFELWLLFDLSLFLVDDGYILEIQQPLLINGKLISDLKSNKIVRC